MALGQIVACFKKKQTMQVNRACRMEKSGPPALMRLRPTWIVFLPGLGSLCRSPGPIVWRLVITSQS